MYPDNTAAFITEAVGNIFHMDKTTINKFQPIDSMYFEWSVESNLIKRIEFADVPVGDGANGTTIIMAFKENYFQKYDIFKIDKTMQQCFVVSRPTRRSDYYWEVEVRLVTDDIQNTILDESGCQIGDTCRFQSNAHPEAHQEGYVKYQSDTTKFRNYITLHILKCA